MCAQTGVPATVMHGGTDKSDSDRKGEEIVFHVVQSFITLMDSVKLGQVANDEVRNASMRQCIWWCSVCDGLVFACVDVEMCVFDDRYGRVVGGC